MNGITTKNISFLVLGIIIIGGIIFFATKQDTKAPTVNPVATSTAIGMSTVTIERYQFSPSALTVKKGETVVWTNNDAAPHTVTTDNRDAGPSIGPLSKGQTYAYTFDTAGVYAYHCIIHPGMKGTITVTE